MSDNCFVLGADRLAGLLARPSVVRLIVPKVLYNLALQSTVKQSHVLGLWHSTSRLMVDCSCRNVNKSEAKECKS